MGAPVTLVRSGNVHALMMFLNRDGITVFGLKALRRWGVRNRALGRATEGDSVEMPSTRLACAKCDRVLTTACRWGSDADREPRGNRSGVAEVPQGIMIRVADADVVRRMNEQGHILHEIEVSPAGAIAINPADFLPDAWEPYGSDNGCCGSDGLDGANRACLCGNVLGTEWSDCWTVHEVRFIPASVKELDRRAF